MTKKNWYVMGYLIMMLAVPFIIFRLLSITLDGEITAREFYENLLSEGNLPMLNFFLITPLLLFVCNLSLFLDGFIKINHILIFGMLCILGIAIIYMIFVSTSYTFPVLSALTVGLFFLDRRGLVDLK